jgi:predicted DNA-binding transcriptional regulator AlpA
MAGKANLRLISEQPALDISRLTLDQVLQLIGERAREMALLNARLVQLVAPVQDQRERADHGDRLLTAQQAALKLGVTTAWIYQRWEKLGGAKIDSGTLRFSEAQLDSYIRNKRSG